MTDSLPAPAQRQNRVAPAAIAGTDPLSEALERIADEPVAVVVSEVEALAEGQSLVDEADRGDYTPWLLSRAIDLAVQFPANEQLQYHVGRLISLSGDAESARLCWRGMVERFPNSHNAFPQYLRTVLKTFGPDIAAGILASHVGTADPATDPARALLVARCRALLGDRDEALALLDRVSSGSLGTEIAIERARLLRMAGRFDEALVALETSNSATAAPELATDIRRATALFSGPHAAGPPSVAALDTLLGKALEHRTKHRPARPAGPIGGVVLIGGSLGGGGAERQLANTALGLTGRAAADHRITGPVSIFCRKLDRRRSNDFYLAKLETADVRVADYLAAPPWGGDPAVSRIAADRELIQLLPPRMREGIIRLTETLRYEAPDVIQIWQDGMIFAAGLAALTANVPRIILTVRTMPPNRRTDRQKPEQEVLYRGLLAAAGVTLTANSRIAGKAYEDWLGLPRGSVLTVANGVDPLPVDAPDDERKRWERFDAQTGGQGFVLGGVMRLDDNKRPLLWLDICAALARRDPFARFVIAGNGPLRSAAGEHARNAGIAERTLFVGRTTHVGFWLEKMDMLALTSRHEGIPNALIEAQLAGVPVLTTPAGGAPEAVAPHPANLVMADAEIPDPEEAARHLHRLSRDAAGGELDIAGRRVRDWARDHYAMDRMIERTLDIFAMR
ncbi:glycosyltransferase [Parasphingopyxis algicola]|uniref:glycosyltransferase n=1 Tax=Parasphingopyxis algicola TaxID=2026624 RepID=UPI0015A02D53|nr:glycosyltransferase [Parasphingopyxis algicola]QLC23666.1 glycosyltransferase [Parasphingopyxis algicola]